MTNKLLLVEKNPMYFFFRIRRLNSVNVLLLSIFDKKSTETATSRKQEKNLIFSKKTLHFGRL